MHGQENTLQDGESLSDRAKDTISTRSSGAHSAASKYKKLQQDAASNRGSLTWADCPADELRDMIVSVTEDGAAILLAKTSDGGALVVRMIADRESVPFYAPDMASLNHLLMEVASLFK